MCNLIKSNTITSEIIIAEFHEYIILMSYLKENMGVFINFLLCKFAEIYGYCNKCNQ